MNIVNPFYSAVRSDEFLVPRKFWTWAIISGKNSGNVGPIVEILGLMLASYV